MMSEWFDKEYIKEYAKAYAKGYVEGYAEGRAEERVKGISSMVGILKSLNIPSADIIEKLTAAYDLTPEAAQEYLSAAR